MPTSRHISVETEGTPNPESMMFYPGNLPVLGPTGQTIKFSNKYETGDSPLAAAIFKVKGVNEVLLAAGHITVTKKEGVAWELIQPNLELVISQFYAAGLQVVKDGVVQKETAAKQPLEDFDPDSVEAQILQVLEERVRPFVQQDGGDVEFISFKKNRGELRLKLHGSCEGCPKSSVTLQHGIKNLMEHYVPEVKSIVADEDEEDLPRAR